jgi:hypothetical protein
MSHFEGWAITIGIVVVMLAIPAKAYRFALLCGLGLVLFAGVLLFV